MLLSPDGRYVFEIPVFCSNILKRPHCDTIVSKEDCAAIDFLAIVTAKEASVPVTPVQQQPPPQKKPARTKRPAPEEPSGKVRAWFDDFSKKGKAGHVGLVPAPFQEHFPKNGHFTWEKFCNTKEAQAVFHYDSHCRE